MEDFYFLLWLLSMASSGTTLGGLYALGRRRVLRQHQISFPKEWILWTRIGGIVGIVLAVVAGTVKYLGSREHGAWTSLSGFVAGHPELLIAIIFGVASAGWSLAVYGGRKS